VTVSGVSGVSPTPPVSWPGLNWEVVPPLLVGVPPFPAASAGVAVAARAAAQESAANRLVRRKVVSPS
jgi:hypothetical protein